MMTLQSDEIETMRDFASFRTHLTRSINGRVVDFGDGEYESLLSIDNGRVSHEPRLIVIPDSFRAGVSKENEKKIRKDLIHDVSTTVRICRDAGVRLTVKSGGHSAAGYCLNTDGVVLDLSNLNWIRFCRDSGRLRVGMGQTFSRIYDFLKASRTGLIPIGGGCPTVGVGGFLLGGGYSFVSRSYGLGSDNVRQLKVVTADGCVHKINDQSVGLDRDLFWATRGGGGGNFGVAVEAELQAHRPPTETMLVGQIWFPFHRLPELFDFYNCWVNDLPNEMAVYGYLGSQPDPRMDGERALSLRFTPIFNGNFSDGMEILKPLLQQQPIKVETFNMTIPEWESLIGMGTVVKGRSAYIRSVVMKERSLTREVAHIFMEHMIRRPSRHSFVVWTHAGGAISDVGNEDTAFAHRNALFVPEVKAIWDSDRPEDSRRNIEWAHRFYSQLQEHGCGSYINYIDPLLDQWQDRYYGANLRRLVDIQRAVDPTEFFQFQQSVGSTFEPDVDHYPLDLSPLATT